MDRRCQGLGVAFDPGNGLIKGPGRLNREVGYGDQRLDPPPNDGDRPARRVPAGPGEAAAGAPRGPRGGGEGPQGEEGRGPGNGKEGGGGRLGVITQLFPGTTVGQTDIVYEGFFFASAHLVFIVILPAFRLPPPGAAVAEPDEGNRTIAKGWTRHTGRGMTRVWQ